MRLLILIPLAMACVMALRGQPSNANRYIFMKETALVATTEKVTVQQPASGSLSVAFELADVYCSVACTVTFYQNGTAATTTTLAATTESLSPPPKVVAFSSSNVGTGNTLKTYYLGAGQTLQFTLGDFALPRGAGGSANFSIGIASMTGTVRIQIQCIEQ